MSSSSCADGLAVSETMQSRRVDWVEQNAWLDRELFQNLGSMWEVDRLGMAGFSPAICVTLWLFFALLSFFPLLTPFLSADPYGG